MPSTPMEIADTMFKIPNLQNFTTVYSDQSLETSVDLTAVSVPAYGRTSAYYLELTDINGYQIIGFAYNAITKGDLIAEVRAIYSGNRVSFTIHNPTNGALTIGSSGITFKPIYVKKEYIGS